MSREQEQKQEQDKIAVLHDWVGKTHELGDLETFRNKLKNPDKRRVFYDWVSPEYDLGTFEEFEEKIDPFLPKSFLERSIDTVRNLFESDKGDEIADLSRKTIDADKDTASDVIDVEGMRIKKIPEGFYKQYVEKRVGKKGDLFAIQKADSPLSVHYLRTDEGIVKVTPDIDIGLDVEGVSRVLAGAFSPTSPSIANLPREGGIAEALDIPITSIRENMPDKPPPNAFALIPGGSDPGVSNVLWNVSKGVATFIDGLSTPSNLLLINAAANLTGTSQRFLSAIFSADMALSLPSIAEDFVARIEEGDIDGAVELGTLAFLTGESAVTAGRHAFRGVEGKPDVLPETKEYMDRIRRALADPEKSEGIREGLQRLREIEEKIRENKARVDELLRRAEIPKSVYREEPVIIGEGRRRQFTDTKINRIARRIAGDGDLSIEERMFYDDNKEAIDRKVEEIRKEGEIRVPPPEEIVALQPVPPEPEGEPERRPDVRIIKPGEPEGRKRVELIKPGGEAVAKDYSNPIVSTMEEISKLPEETTAEKIEAFFRKKRAETRKPTKTKIIVEGKVDRRALKNFRKAMRFMEAKFPYLMNLMDEVHFWDRETFRKKVDPYAIAMFIHSSDGSREMHFLDKAHSSMTKEHELEKSPQLMEGAEIEARIDKTEMFKEPRPLTVPDFINTIAEEFQHNQDLVRFGREDFKLLMKSADVTEFLEMKAGLRVAPPYVLPYYDQLIEKRGKARSRVAVRVFGEAFRESVKAILEVLNPDAAKLISLPALPIFTEENFAKARPHFVAAWRLYKRAGKEFAEFSRDVIGELGDNAAPYVARLQRELALLGEGGVTVKKDEVKPSEEYVDVRGSSPEEVMERSKKELRDLETYSRTWSQKIIDLLSVEARYRRVSAPQTGRAVKNMYGEQVKHLDEALRVSRDIMRHLTKGTFSIRSPKEDLAKIVLAAEDPRYLRSLPKDVQARYAKPVQMIREYFERSKKEYERFGVKVDFIQRLKDEMVAEITARIEKGEDIADLQASLKDLSEMKFVHIPTAVWFQKAIKDPSAIRRVLKTLVDRKRKTLSIRSLLDAGVISVEDLSIIDILANYGRIKGKDMALLKIVEAAKKEGLAKGLNKKGKVDKFFSRPPRRAPILRGFQIHPLLKQWIFEAIAPYSTFSILDRGLSQIKMLQFYNPFFLPMYDVIQGAMAGSMFPHAMLTMGGAAIGGVPGAAIGALVGEIGTRGRVSRGMYHAIKQTDLYLNAYADFSSTPFPNTFDSFFKMVERAKMTRPGRVFDVLTDFPGALSIKRLARGERALKVLYGLLPGQLISDVYNMSWGIAWTLDRGMRMTTYLYLRNKGFSHTDAAQLTALFHADYASVPRNTRKMLNRIFFTPTFKIAMGKLFGRMIEGSIKTLKNPKGADAKNRQLMTGLTRTGAVLIATHLLMKAYGFDEDEYAVRYTRPTLSDEGPKDIVISFSNPANMFLKYAERVYASTKPGGTFGADLFRRMKWEFHPLWRISYNLVNNKDDAGDPIYSPFDKPLYKALKAARYTATNVFALVGLGGLDVSKKDDKAREKLANEVGQSFELIVRPFTNVYLRDPLEKRALGKILNMREQLLDMIRKGQITPEEAAQQAREMEKQIMEIMEDLQEVK